MNRAWHAASWIVLLHAVALRAQDATIHIDANHSLHTISPNISGLCLEDVNHEIYGGLYSQMIFGESFAEPADAHGISKMWSAVTTGDAKLQTAITADGRIPGQSGQQITFAGGSGEVGIANRGLNHQGMSFEIGKPYEGYVWLRGSHGQSVILSFESEDGSQSFARQTIRLVAESWQRYDVALTPNADQALSARGRFSIRLTEPGSITVSYVFLQPGPWGRFHNLPVRRDVAEAMLSTGVRFIRYGGSMVNEPGYRVRNMYGERDDRPGYKGHWYPHSSSGWSVVDFLNFCEAAGVEAIPDFNIDESPIEIADFVEYANGAADTLGGKRRITDGHPKPYNLRHIELGNEEKIDTVFASKFIKTASALWLRDKQVTPIAGDFGYRDLISNPFEISGADSGIRSLDGHERILSWAREHNTEVWFDVHVWSEGLPQSPSAHALSSYIDAIDKLANGAKHRVVVFELNANTHDQARALSSSAVMLDVLRDGRLPMVSSANALQIDGQNDNGWDQGLVFLNPSKTWLQPSGFAMQMFDVSNGATVIASEIVDGDGLNVVALQTASHQQVSLLVLNVTDKSRTATVQLNGFSPTRPEAVLTVLAGDLKGVNRAEDPQHLVPRRSTAPIQNSSATVQIDPHGLLRIDIR